MVRGERFLILRSSIILSRNGVMAGLLGGSQIIADPCYALSSGQRLG